MMKTRTVYSSVILVGALASVAIACSANNSSKAGGDKSDLAKTSGRATDAVRKFDRNNVIDDASMTDVSSMTSDGVQKFFEHTPYNGARSALADYRPKGKLASSVIVETATAYKISPLLLVVELQAQRGLVSKTKATTADFDVAFACGCANVTTCSSADYVGFENQTRCAAATFRRSLDRLKGSKGETLSGWAKGKKKDTEDKLSVTPANFATAALYTYTPWVGKLGGGGSDVGGVSAQWQLYNSFNDTVTGKSKAVVATSGGTGADGGVATTTSKALDKCEGVPPCAAGTLCDSETGGCVAGCRIGESGTATDSPCPNGQRCDHSDGTIGTCRVLACQCSGGLFCDTSRGTPKCVQCTPSDTTNCRADAEGSACLLPNGTCGCLTNGDCGFDRGRICDLATKTCIINPSPKSSSEAESEEEGRTTTNGGGNSNGTGEEAPPPPPDLPPSEPTRSGSGSEGSSGAGASSSDSEGTSSSSSSSSSSGSEDGSDAEETPDQKPLPSKRSKEDSGCSVSAVTGGLRLHNHEGMMAPLMIPTLGICLIVVRRRYRASSSRTSHPLRST